MAHCILCATLFCTVVLKTLLLACVIKGIYLLNNKVEICTRVKLCLLVMDAGVKFVYCKIFRTLVLADLIA